MRILNLEVDDLYLNCIYSEQGLILDLGEPVGVAPNHVILTNPTIDFTDCSKLKNCYELSFIDDGTCVPLLSEMSKAKRGTFSGVPNSHNYLFAGVLSLDGKNLVDCFKIWGTDRLLSSTKLLAYGLRGSYDMSNKMLPYALFYIDKNCDYEIDGIIYSGRSGDEITKTKHKHCYSIENVLDICLSNK